MLGKQLEMSASILYLLLITMSSEVSIVDVMFIIHFKKDFFVFHLS